MEKQTTIQELKATLEPENINQIGNEPQNEEKQLDRVIVKGMKQGDEDFASLRNARDGYDEDEAENLSSIDFDYQSESFQSYLNGTQEVLQKKDIYVMQRDENEAEMSSLFENLNVEPKKRRAQRKYSDNQIQDFMDAKDSNPTISVSKLAREHGINKNTALDWVRNWREKDVFPRTLKKGREPKLSKSIHGPYILNLIEEDPAIILSQIVIKLKEEFELSVCMSTLSKFMRNDLNQTLGKQVKEPKIRKSKS